MFFHGDACLFGRRLASSETLWKRSYSALLISPILWCSAVTARNRSSQCQYIGTEEESWCCRSCTKEYARRLTYGNGTKAHGTPRLEEDWNAKTSRSEEGWRAQQPTPLVDFLHFGAILMCLLSHYDTHHDGCALTVSRSIRGFHSAMANAKRFRREAGRRSEKSRRPVGI